MAAPLIVNEESHERPWTLSHRVSGPNHVIVGYDAGRVASIVTWDALQTFKLREVFLTYDLEGKLETIERRQWDGAANLLSTSTGTISRDGQGNVTTVEWVVT